MPVGRVEIMSGLSPDLMADSLACMRIILEGGADPTVPAYEESSRISYPSLWHALSCNSFVNLVKTPL